MFAVAFLPEAVPVLTVPVLAEDGAFPLFSDVQDVAEVQVVFVVAFLPEAVWLALPYLFFQ